MKFSLQRRYLIGAGTATLALGPNNTLTAQEGSTTAPTLAPVRATPDRLIDINVCPRPFRAKGPRFEAQRLHGKAVVHHYGTVAAARHFRGVRLGMPCR